MGPGQPDTPLDCTVDASDLSRQEMGAIKRRLEELAAFRVEGYFLLVLIDGAGSHKETWKG